MCGRYAVFAPPHKLKDLFGTGNLVDFTPRYNAAPLQTVPAIIRDRMGLARWGLLPPWAAPDDRTLAAKMINARSETAMVKPAFREAWMRRRCLIPASGFYEWKEEAGGKQPYYIRHPAHDVLAFAGLWAKTGDIVTFTILTKDADNPVAGLHHRTPVILYPGQAAEWFAADEAEALRLIAAARSDELDFYPVGKAVNDVRNDSENMIVPGEGAPPALALPL